MITEETRNKMRVSQKRRFEVSCVWNKGKKTGIKPWLGKSRSEETKSKISQSKIGQNSGHKNYFYGKRGELSPAWREKNPNWKGGISQVNRTLRQNIMSLSEYKEWRKAVFERDAFTCQTCGDRGVILNADHIEAFSLLLTKHGITDVQKALLCADLWKITNGRTLCVECHSGTSNYKGRAKRRLKANQTIL